jgi:hypothetical protein
MPANINNINTKLAALAAKDLPALVDAQVHIPFLAEPYTLAQLQAWVAKRSNQLQSAKTATDAQLLAAKNTAYNGLNATGKAIADQILAGQFYTLPANLTAANYDKLIAIILYVFITAP